MLSLTQIRAKFGKDKNHFALADFVLTKGAQILYAEQDGLLAYFCDIHVLFGASGKGLENALSLVDKASCFVCSSPAEGDAVNAKFGFSMQKPCYQILYEKPFGALLPENTVVKPLPPTDENIDFVTATYTLGFAREDIKRLMSDYTFYATYTGGELSGYIGRHDEGSIGLLEIFPKFRRMGLGAFLVDYMVERLTKDGEIAYCNIETTNEKSLKMHLKMGFVPSKNLVYWCK
ncbi:MAG: GNAT family N-acetyltransferase [Clostridia bacterium]|nr:GNAT family N-acetyltransferase [Clostridia bacterium]